MYKDVLLRFPSSNFDICRFANWATSSIFGGTTQKKDKKKSGSSSSSGGGTPSSLHETVAFMIAHCSGSDERQKTMYYDAKERKDRLMEESKDVKERKAALDAWHAWKRKQQQQSQQRRGENAEESEMWQVEEAEYRELSKTLDERAKVIQLKKLEVEAEYTTLLKAQLGMIQGSPDCTYEQYKLQTQARKSAQQQKRQQQQLAEGELLKRQEDFRRALDAARVKFLKRAEDGQKLTREDIHPLVDYTWSRSPKFKKLYESAKYDIFAQQICAALGMKYNKRLSWQVTTFLCTLRMLNEDLHGSKEAKASSKTQPQPTTLPGSSISSTSLAGGTLLKLELPPEASLASGITITITPELESVRESQNSKVGADTETKTAATTDAKKKPPAKAEKETKEKRKLTRLQKTIKGNAHRNPDLSDKSKMKGNKREEGSIHRLDYHRCLNKDDPFACTIHDLPPSARDGGEICACCYDRFRNKRIAAATAANERALAVCADFFDENYICVFCEYKLIYGEYPKMLSTMHKWNRDQGGKKKKTTQSKTTHTCTS